MLKPQLSRSERAESEKQQAEGGMVRWSGRWTWDMHAELYSHSSRQGIHWQCLKGNRKNTITCTCILRFKCSIGIAALWDRLTRIKVAQTSWPFHFLSQNILYCVNGNEMAKGQTTIIRPVLFLLREMTKSLQWSCPHEDQLSHRANPGAHLSNRSLLHLRPCTLSGQLRSFLCWPWRAFQSTLPGPRFLRQLFFLHGNPTDAQPTSFIQWFLCMHAYYQYPHHVQAIAQALAHDNPWTDVMPHTICWLLPWDPVIIILQICVEIMHAVYVYISCKLSHIHHVSSKKVKKHRKLCHRMMEIFWLRPSNNEIL